MLWTSEGAFEAAGAPWATVRWAPAEELWVGRQTGIRRRWNRLRSLIMYLAVVPAADGRWVVPCRVVEAGTAGGKAPLGTAAAARKAAPWVVGAGAGTAGEAAACTPAVAGTMGVAVLGTSEHAGTAGVAAAGTLMVVAVLGTPVEAGGTGGVAVAGKPGVAPVGWGLGPVVAAMAAARWGQRASVAVSEEGT